MAQIQSGNQPLASKESQLFRQVVKLYESKQYKKAIKAADQILKKHPDHGETLAMKGLTLNYMDKKEDAYDLVRKGLKADLRSHVCWHVYGLLYRSDNNYTEAIKCYLNALRIDKDNVQILRDLAMLQIQMRDMSGFVDTRQKLLALKPTNRIHWIAFAVGHHLEGNHELAVQILDAYESTQEEIPASEAYEHSELLLYKAQVLAEGGQAERALSLLQTSKDKIKARLDLLRMEAQLLQSLGRQEEAAQLFRKILAINTDDRRMHTALHTCLGLAPPAGSSYSDVTPEQRVDLRQLYKQLRASYPHSLAAARIPLDFEVGEEFETEVEAYARRFVLRGIPSLFSDLKPLYRDPKKVAVLQRLFEGYRAALEATGSLPPLKQGGAQEAGAEEEAREEEQQRGAGQPADSATSSSGADHSCNGSTGCSGHGHGNGTAAAAAAGSGAGNSSTQDGEPLTWTLHYLAQHYDRLGDTGAALAAVDAALERCPQLIELHSSRSRILKHAGDPQGSAQCAEAARLLDLADRYLNSAAVRALFRAGRALDAEAAAMLFTRDGDNINNLHDMQHMWYELLAGAAHLASAEGEAPGAGAANGANGASWEARSREYGRALKKFTAVGKHFADFAEDQFDFHSYCVRKMTLRAYVALLRLEDQLYGHDFYAEASWGAVRCYLALHDAPAAAAAKEAAEDAELAALSPDERKKEKLRRRKEEKRRERDAAEKAEVERVEREKLETERRAKEKDASSSSGGGAKKRAAPSKPGDPDPDGAKLAACSDPLGEATKLVCMLKRHAPDRLRTQLAAYEVYSRKGRLLLALSAVQRARALAGEGDADVHRITARFARQVEQVPPATPVVAKVLSEALPALLGGAASAAEYAARWRDSHAGGSISQRAAAAEVMALLEPSTKDAALALLLEGVGGVGSGQAGHTECLGVLRMLQRPPLADAGAAAKWKAACGGVFKWSAFFEGCSRS